MLAATTCQQALAAQSAYRHLKHLQAVEYGYAERIYPVILDFPDSEHIRLIKRLLTSTPATGTKLFMKQLPCGTTS